MWTSSIFHSQFPEIRREREYSTGIGCTADQTQLDTWSGYVGGSSNGALDKGANREHIRAFVEDPAAINSLSLCHLSPLYTLVIDPEGTAEEHEEILSQ